MALKTACALTRVHRVNVIVVIIICHLAPIPWGAAFDPCVPGHLADFSYRNWGALGSLVVGVQLLEPYTCCCQGTLRRHTPACLLWARGLAALKAVGRRQGVGAHGHGPLTNHPFVCVFVNVCTDLCVLASSHWPQADVAARGDAVIVLHCHVQQAGPPVDVIPTAASGWGGLSHKAS